MKVNIAAVAIIGLAAIGASGALHPTLRAQQTAPAPEAPATSSGPAGRSVWDGVYTEAQAKRGEQVYTEYCVACHGNELEGGEMGSPLAGAAFTPNWNGLSVGDLYERVRLTMPMDAPGKLTSQQNADVLAYVLSGNKFPAGKTELARQPEFLKQIKFEATKP